MERDAKPDIQVEQKKVGTWDDAKDNLYTKLAAGSGLSDVEAIEGDAMPAILAESGAFVDLTDPELDGRWLDWKAAAATDADGKMIGYGTDAGPEGICYRADLFEKAGLPTDRAEVAGLLGTWDDYFATGEEFVKAVPDTAWYDSSGGTAQAMLNQVENPFETDDNTIDVENPELQAVYDTITGNVDEGPVHHTLPVERRLDGGLPERRLRHHGLPRLDAGRGVRQRRRRQGLGLRRRVPRRRRQLGRLVPDGPDAVRAPRPGQGVRGVDHRAGAAGQGLRGDRRLPEPGGGTRRPRGREATNEFFNNAPTGEILSNRAAAITVQPYKGPKYSDILQAFQAALLRVDDGSQHPEESWDTFLADVERLS